MQNSWLLCGAFHQKNFPLLREGENIYQRAVYFTILYYVYRYRRALIKVRTEDAWLLLPDATSEKLHVTTRRRENHPSSLFIFLSLIFFLPHSLLFFPMCVWRYRMELIRVSFKKVKTWVVVHARARSPSRIGLCDVMLGTHRSPSGWLILFNLGYKLKGVYLMPRPSRRPPWKLTSWRCWICMSMAQKKQVWL